MPEPAAGDDGERATMHGEQPPADLDEAQLSLLAAGVRLLAKLDRDDLTRLVSAVAVADEADMHRQTIYRRWDNHGAFVDALIAYIADPSRSVGVERFDELEGQADEVDPDDPAAEVRRLSSQTFGRFTGDATQMVRMLLWSAHLNDEHVAEEIRRLYRTNDEAAARGFGHVGQALGIEPRPPFTLDSIAILFNALRDGLVLHLGIEPDRVPESFFGDVMVAVTNAVVRRIGDPDDEIDVDEVFRRAVGRPEGTDDT